MWKPCPEIAVRLDPFSRQSRRYVVAIRPSPLAPATDAGSPQGALRAHVGGLALPRGGARRSKRPQAVLLPGPRLGRLLHQVPLAHPGRPVREPFGLPGADHLGHARTPTGPRPGPRRRCASSGIRAAASAASIRRASSATATCCCSTTAAAPARRIRRAAPAPGPPARRRSCGTTRSAARATASPARRGTSSRWTTATGW